ncbi:MAG: hypothetical protein QOJ46_457 [bacterium]|jgi:hypothetical protein
MRKLVAVSLLAAPLILAAPAQAQSTLPCPPDKPCSGKAGVGVDATSNVGTLGSPVLLETHVYWGAAAGRLWWDRRETEKAFRYLVPTASAAAVSTILCESIEWTALDKLCRAYILAQAGRYTFAVRTAHRLRACLTIAQRIAA